MDTSGKVEESTDSAVCRPLPQAFFL